MKKTLKSIQKKYGMLNEGYAWERTPGKALPTLEDVQNNYNAKSTTINENDDPVLMNDETHVAKRNIQQLQNAINKWDRKIKPTSPKGSLEILKHLNSSLKTANSILADDLGVAG